MENLKRNAALYAPAFPRDMAVFFKHLSRCRRGNMPFFGHPHPAVDDAVHDRPHRFQRSPDRVIHSLNGSSGSHCGAMMSSLPQQGTYQEAYPEHRRGKQRSKTFNRLSYCKIANGMPVRAPFHIQCIRTAVQRATNGCTNGVNQQSQQSATLR